MKTKVQILIADLVRVMRNISPLLTQFERRKLVPHVIDRMQNSGYNIKERKKIYVKAKLKYDKVVSEDKNERTPMYRHKEWEKKEEIKKNVKKEKND